MAYGIDEFGNDTAPPGFAPAPPMPIPTAQEDAAKQFARKRLLAALAGGLGNPNRGGGFLGGLASGFSGAVGAGMGFEQQKQAEYRQQRQDEAQVRRDVESQRRWDATFGLQRKADLRAEADQLYQDAKRLKEPVGPDYHGYLPPDAPFVLKGERFPADIPYTPENTKAYGETVARKRAEALFPNEKPREGLAQIAGPDGNPIWVRQSDAIGKPAARSRPAVTGAERTALAFYNRAKGAAESIETPDKAGASLEDKMARLPLTQQAQLRYAHNVFQTSEQQMYRQSQRAFTEARLRKESGAAIPTHEYENDSRTYFAQPGDSKATIAAKRKARKIVLSGLKFSSGKAYDEYYGGADHGGDVDAAPQRIDDPAGIR